MSKYDGRYDSLKHHLQTRAASELPMTFSEIESVVGTKLPRSAKLYRTWWSNNASNHTQAKAWLDAGYCTERVDMDGAKLVFVRSGVPRGLAESQREFGVEEVRTGQHPLIGCMKGTFTIEPGWDLKKPALDREELDAMEANLDRTADLIESGLSKKSQ
jgi:hypothetical protein